MRSVTVKLNRWKSADGHRAGQRPEQAKCLTQWWGRIGNGKGNGIAIEGRTGEDQSPAAHQRRRESSAWTNEYCSNGCSGRLEP